MEWRWATEEEGEKRRRGEGKKGRKGEREV